MAKRRFDLTEVKKGNNISWFIASQAYYTGCIKLSDESGKVYVDVSKRTTSTNYTVVGNGNFDFKGTKLFLDIDIPQSSEIHQSISANSITDNLARKVGQIYTFCIEDSTDGDYNDFYINIAAWDKKG